MHKRKEGIWVIGWSVVRVREGFEHIAAHLKAVGMCAFALVWCLRCLGNGVLFNLGKARVSM